jgi:hypothetical protein
MGADGLSAFLFRYTTVLIGHSPAAEKKAPLMRGFSLSAIPAVLCPAASAFVHRDLQTDNFLPYGAIDCIAVNRCG